MGQMRVGAGASRARRRSQGAKSAALDKALPIGERGPEPLRETRPAPAMGAGTGDRSGCTRPKAKAGRLVAIPRLPVATAHPAQQHARRRANLKAWYLSTAACVATLCTAAQGADQGALVYVPNSEGNSVSIIDTASNTTIATIDSVGQSPSTVSVSGDQAHVYVAAVPASSRSILPRMS